MSTTGAQTPETKPSEQEAVPRERRQGLRRLRDSRWLQIITAAVVLALLAGAGTVYMGARPPAQAAWSTAEEAVLVLAGERQESPPVLDRDGALYLPFPWVAEHLDPTLLWDPEGNRVIYTSSDAVLRLPLGSTQGSHNGEPYALEFPVTLFHGVPHLPVSLLSRLYPYAFVWHADSATLTVDAEGETAAWGKVVAAPRQWYSSFLPGGANDDEAVWLETEPAPTASVIARLPQGERVWLFGERDGHYLARDEAGHVGWVAKERLQLMGAAPLATGLQKADSAQTTAIAAAATAATATPWLGQQPFVLTFEQVGEQNPSTKAIWALPTVNVVAPTWFALRADGTLKNTASRAYVDWAHANGKQVWALASNGFEPERTHQLLASAAARERFVTTLLSYAALYGFDGINLDFENVYLADGPDLTQLVRELVPLAHERRLTVSVDVTVKSSSEQWSLFYDRAALAQTADFVVLMAYDQHYAGGEPGPVAALDWVGRSLDAVLQEVPPRRLLLGVPFYTRLWRVHRAADGSESVTSQAIPMQRAADLAALHGVAPVWLPDMKQYFVQYQEDGDRVQIWYDGAESVQARVDLAREKGLAGLAAWRRGLESEEVWPAFQTLERGPY